MRRVAGTDLMTTEEVAALCRTSTKTVEYWQYRRTGPPSFRIGTRRVYDRAEVEAWIDAKRETA